MRNWSSDGSFHQAISSVLFEGTFLGFPVYGIFTKNISDLRFSWKSLRAVHSLYLLITSIFCLICYVNWMIRHGDPNLSKFVSLAELILNILSLVGFQKLAKKWPELMRKWASVEDSLPKQSNSKEKRLLKKRIMMVQILVCSVSAGE